MFLFSFVFLTLLQHQIIVIIRFYFYFLLFQGIKTMVGLMNECPQKRINNGLCRGLRSQAHFERDKTIRDWRAIPELEGPGKDYIFWSCCSRKSGKNRGLLSTFGESLEQYQILRLFSENLYKQYHSELFLVGTVVLNV